MHILIQDNGVGITKPTENQNAHKKKNLGISFTKERLVVFDAQHGTVSSMSIGPSINGGTEVLVVLGQSWLL